MRFGAELRMSHEPAALYRVLLALKSGEDGIG